MAGSFLAALKTSSTLFRPGLLATTVAYGANATGIMYYLKHTILLKTYKEYSERYGNYGPDEPADELNNMFNEVISKDLKDLASENTPIELFLTSGMKTAHLGTLGTLAGGFVGVPVFYEFKKEKDIEDNILVRGVNNEDAENHQEKELRDSFLLSDKAKKYGIAREVLMINTLRVPINAILPFAISMILVLSYKDLPQTHRVFKKPFYMRAPFYTAWIILGSAIWSILYKNVLEYYESEVESRITQLGVDYVEGGVEYCTKELKRDSFSVEIKSAKVGIFNAIDNFFCKWLPTGIPVETRLNYLKAHLEQNSKKLQQ